jgi:hypothetical protein
MKTSEELKISFNKYLKFLFFGVASISLLVILGALFEKIIDPKNNLLMTVYVILFIPSVISLFIAYFYPLIFLYRFWDYVIIKSKALNIELNISDPDKAIFFILMPIFNIYGVFVYIGGLANIVNLIAEKSGSKEKMKPYLGYIISISIVLYYIPPLISLLIHIISIILFPIFINQVLKVIYNINEIEDVK